MKIGPGYLDVSYDFNKIRHHSSWDNGSNRELRMHRIHAYPAKFPSFLISKSLKYAEKKKININTIGDIFCGCGTTALEAKKNQKDFWGCDINPVATLIAEVKSETYNITLLNQYYASIIKKYEGASFKTPKKYLLHERINYWFTISQIHELYKLLRLIKKEIPEGLYQNFFLVAFSNILKGASRWLTKSIKPTIDQKKPVNQVKKLFAYQVRMMIKATTEVNTIVARDFHPQIDNVNFLKFNSPVPFLDMLICSPPYVTSYEYADLHQLSTLWLGYVRDFKTLRNGTIGSVYHRSIVEEEIAKLNEIGRTIYEQLVKAKKSKAKSIAKYFIDMSNTVTKSYSLIKRNGLAVFVIGNTKHKGVYIDNAKFLIRCMIDTGFCDIDIYKRRISSKILSPYRNKDGKFSSDKRKRKVYSYEFVIIAHKK